MRKLFCFRCGLDASQLRHTQAKGNYSDTQSRNFSLFWMAFSGRIVLLAVAGDQGRCPAESLADQRCVCGYGREY